MRNSSESLPMTCKLHAHPGLTFISTKRLAFGILLEPMEVL
jgi:hypothetical protein